jgi:hypothetical protein
MNPHHGSKYHPRLRGQPRAEAGWPSIPCTASLPAGARWPLRRRTGGRPRNAAHSLQCVAARRRQQRAPEGCQGSARQHPRCWPAQAVGLRLPHDDQASQNTRLPSQTLPPERRGPQRHRPLALRPAMLGTGARRMRCGGGRAQGRDSASSEPSKDLQRSGAALAATPPGAFRRPRGQGVHCSRCKPFLANDRGAPSCYTAGTATPPHLGQGRAAELAAHHLAAATWAPAGHRYERRRATPTMPGAQPPELLGGCPPIAGGYAEARHHFDDGWR